jgi:hypothetical protein
VLFPCMYILHPKLFHLYHTSSLLPSAPHIVASCSLRLLYLFLYSKHINHIQVYGFLPCPIPPMSSVLLVICVLYYSNVTPQSTALIKKLKIINKVEPILPPLTIRPHYNGPCIYHNDPK